MPFVADHNVEGNKGTSSGDEGATLSERTAHKSASTGLTDITWSLACNIIGLTQRAVAGPPLGTQLGAMGINIAAFVKDFNLRTSVFREGVPLPTRTTVNADRSYNLVIHHPTNVYFLKQVRLARKVDMV